MWNVWIDVILDVLYKVLGLRYKVGTFVVLVSQVWRMVHFACFSI